MLRGWISDYHEQGMEGDYWLTFQDEQFVEGGQWDRAGMYILRPGDHLTIFTRAGDVLWSGVIGASRTRLIDEWVYRLRQWMNSARGYRRWYPEGVEPSRWLGWFRERPSLRAELVPAGDESERRQRRVS